MRKIFQSAGKKTRYIDWLTFCGRTGSLSLRASMMDLHWFVNNGNALIGMRDIFRFFYYALRFIMSSRGMACNRADLLLVVDSPAAGGLQTLLPLLACKPKNVAIVIAVSNYVANDKRYIAATHNDKSIQTINMDRSSLSFRWEKVFVLDALRITFQHPRLIMTLPIFLLRYFVYGATAARIFELTQSRMVVLFNERMLLSAGVSEVARKLGMSTYAVQHGNFVDNYLPVMVDCYLTWGSYHSQWLASRAACKTIVMGSPRTECNGIAKLNQWCVPVDRPVHIVFFSQVGSATVSAEWISTTRKMILSLTEVEGIRISIKLHPFDTKERWLSEGPLAQRATYLGGDTSMTESLKDADIMSSFYSTVLIEGLLHDLPVIQLNPYPEAVNGFPNKDGIISVVDPEGFLKLISLWRQSEEELLKLRDHQANLSKGYFSNIGKACENFWGVVLGPSDGLSLGA